MPRLADEAGRAARGGCYAPETTTRDRFSLAALPLCVWPSAMVALALTIWDLEIRI